MESITCETVCMRRGTATAEWQVGTRSARHSNDCLDELDVYGCAECAERVRLAALFSFLKAKWRWH